MTIVLLSKAFLDRWGPTLETLLIATGNSREPFKLHVVVATVQIELLQQCTHTQPGSPLNYSV